MIIFLDIYLKVPDVDLKKELDVVSSGVLGPYKKTKNIDCFTTTYAFLTLII